MTKKYLLALLCTATMFQSACAQETVGDAVSEGVTNAAAATSSAVSETVETAAKTAVTETVLASPVYSAPDAAWRTPDPENTLYIDTKHGRIVVELYPELAPGHVARIKQLTRDGFYDGIIFHRVIEDFMNQTGDPKGDGTGDSSYPDLKAEFAFSRDMGKMPVKMLGDMKSKLGSNAITGFYKALPVATLSDDTLFMTKKGAINSYGLHCKGVASMARGGHSVDSANSQFFLMRADYRSLDNEYSIWGTTIHGHDVLTKINVGVVGQPGFTPDSMQKVRIAADVPAGERTPVQVLKTDTQAIYNYTDWLKKQSGRRAKICEIQIPSRLKK